MVMMSPSAEHALRAVDPRFAGPARLGFVIGAQKAGTNWIHAYLGKHPEASVPLLKETGYWSRIRPPHRQGDRLAKALRAQQAKGVLGRTAARLLRGRYLQTLDLATRFAEGDQGGSHSVYADVLLQDWRGQPLAAEVDPQNALLGRDTYAEMAGLGRDVRFVFVMRDPVSRLVSGLRHALQNRHGEQGVTPDRLAALLREGLDKGGETLAFRRSRYDLTLAELEAAVPADRIHLFLYETFFTPGEFDRFNRALGLKPIKARLDRVSHGGAGKGAALPQALLAEARAVLAPCYDAIRRRLGDDLPAAWLRAGGAVP